MLSFAVRLGSEEEQRTSTVQRYHESTLSRNQRRRPQIGALLTLEGSELYTVVLDLLTAQNRLAISSASILKLLVYVEFLPMKFSRCTTKILLSM